MLVIGSAGQIARALAGRSDGGIAITCLGRPQVDLTDAASIERAIGRIEPDIVVNAAAYTAVDKAESEPDVAFAINRDGARNVAAAAAAAGKPVIHLSTDYVFSGSKPSPYLETDRTEPISAYGRSKLAGEQAVAQTNPAHVILRTAWVYAPWGNNFARTMLRLAETRDVIRVVADQHGTPTYAPDIAEAIIAVAHTASSAPSETSWRGIFHLTSQGSTTWAGFAEAIFEASGAAGVPAAKVEPIPTAQYPTPARRPANSRLDTSKFLRIFGHQLPDWKEAVARFVEAYDRRNS